MRILSFMTGFQNFYACHILTKHISHLEKAWIAVENKNILFGNKKKLFLELGQMSLRYDKQKKFGLLTPSKFST